MWRFSIPMLLLAAVTSCSSREAKPVTQVSLTSAAFQPGQSIPARYTCDGENVSPPLNWSEPPPGTRSFALVVDDPDAPSGTFHHWGAYNVPASTRAIAEGQAVGSQAINDFGKLGYGGPCPPPGHVPHRYRFKLFALDGDLSLPVNAKVTDVEAQAKNHLLGRGEIVGTYERRR